MSDIFLSYSHADQEFARRLRSSIVEAGVRVWFDEGEMKVGDSLIAKIEAAISEMTYLGVVLSPRSVASPWVQREVRAALTEEIQNECVKVLPLLIENCEIPGFLRDKLYADFRGNYQRGLSELLHRLKPLVLSQDDFFCSHGKPKKTSNLGFVAKITCDKMNLTMH